MIRALIIIKASNIATARELAQQAPFNVPFEVAQELFQPANEQRSADSFSVLTPATVFWASGEFTESHYAAMRAHAEAFTWASVDTYDLNANPDYPQTRLAELLAAGSGESWQFAQAVSSNN